MDTNLCCNCPDVPYCTRWGCIFSKEDNSIIGNPSCCTADVSSNNQLSQGEEGDKKTKESESSMGELASKPGGKCSPNDLWCGVFESGSPPQSDDHNRTGSVSSKKLVLSTSAMQLFVLFGVAVGFFASMYVSLLLTAQEFNYTEWRALGIQLVLMFPILVIAHSYVVRIDRRHIKQEKLEKEATRKEWSEKLSQMEDEEARVVVQYALDRLQTKVEQRKQETSHG